MSKATLRVSVPDPEQKPTDDFYSAQGKFDLPERYVKIYSPYSRRRILDIVMHLTSHNAYPTIGFVFWSRELWVSLATYKWLKEHGFLRGAHDTVQANVERLARREGIIE